MTGYDFILLDDGVNIYENPFLGPPFIENTLVFWKTAYEHLYIPFTYTVWQALAAVSQGLRPGFFHFTNLTVHLLNTLILLSLLNRVERNFLSGQGCEQADISNAKMGAFMGALLFSLHPLQVESVCWVTELKGLLSTLLSFLSISLYCSFFLNKKRAVKYIFYLASTFTFTLALLSKPSSTMLPFIVFIFISFTAEEKRLSFLPLVPWMLIIVPFVIVTKMAQPDLGLEYVTPWYLRPLVAADALSFYIHKLFFPVNLSVDYGRSPDHMLQNPRTWLYQVFPAAAYLLLFLYRKKTPFFKYLLVTALALLPVLGLIPFLFQKISTVSDHYFYMAMIGPALLLARLVTLKWDKPLWKFSAVAVMTIISFQSFKQVYYWKDSLSLFNHTVKVNPSSKLGHTNLGRYYFLNANFNKARFHYRKLVSYYPEDPLHLTNLAAAYFALGRNDESLRTFKKAIIYDPDFIVAHQNLSNIFEKLGKPGKALFHANESLRIEPDNPETKKQIARLLLLNAQGK